MYKGRLLRLLSFLGLTGVLAVLASSAALAQPAPVYCLDGSTVTLPVTLTLEGHSRALTQSLVDGFIVPNSFDHSTFYTVVLPGFPVLFFSAPAGPSDDPSGFSSIFEKHSIHAGACTGREAGVPRSFWACYSKTQTDPMVAGLEGTAKGLYALGMSVPYATLDPLSSTKLNSGVYLTCTLPTGYSVKSGVAVSTGGGEIWDSTGTVPGAIPATTSYVQYLLTAPETAGGYTQLAVKQ